MNIRQFLDAKVAHALHMAGAPEGSAGMVRPSARANFGDYQANGVMAVAKSQGLNPRELALKVQRLLEAELGDVVEKFEVAGPGFINIFLNPQWVAGQLEQAYGSERAGVSQAQPPQTVVVDLSAPNVAKEMHVGHLRSTVIGDAVSRTLEFLGHKVIRANHIGDWGTQFGMLIAHLEELQKENPAIMEAELGDLEQFYRESKTHYDENPDFAERARGYVVKLQGGDPWCLQMWRKLVDVTMVQNQRTYDRLNVKIRPEDTMGESMYNDMLPAIVADLKTKGLAVEDEGALVVYLDEFKGKDGEPMGVIVQKRDGGFLYTTTDIACAKYRYETLGADRVLYYIDARQAQHLQHAWTIVRKAGYVPDTVPLEHHAFGVMLGKDGKPFKTRSGGTVKLSDLLDEALSRATALIASKSPDMDAAQQAEVANAVAIGAVKYADLSKNRTTDYVFDWDNMLSFEGNTAPYLQYAVTRIRSIFRKAGVEVTGLQGALVINEAEERALATKLVQFNEVVDNLAREGCPHLLCTYLYELAGAFMTFYEACPVNKDGVDVAVRDSRLKLCALVARELELGLGLLGIDTVEQM
ncbi:arginine--tRNA ligase [Aestuariirhabdus litorea]|uniref:Arginine--tRNA ligase n=1 Tax=Aestuariirhabdus litorea TaxID=2528527 RepID=A0A3P3VK92_9GAMM|nr:arginine--tRNA ligase [Aestuariirhabdus litorea]RRJ83145.1 arginine--tRNA ligase [Aestuariirhabdus litorea]RWW93302.1 arginine--tRNA ligase [Endozoicomonadaceae bacterium GTF-13]